MSLPSRDNSSGSLSYILNEDGGATGQISESPVSIPALLNDVPASNSRSVSLPSTSIPTPSLDHLPLPNVSHPGSPQEPAQQPTPAPAPLLERKRVRTSNWVSEHVETEEDRSAAHAGRSTVRQRVEAGGNRESHGHQWRAEGNEPVRQRIGPNTQRAEPVPHLFSTEYRTQHTHRHHLAQSHGLYMPYIAPRPTILSPPVAQLRAIPIGAPSTRPGSGIQRTTTACDTCKRKKTRCFNDGDKTIPCRSCELNQRACTYTGIPGRRGPPPGKKCPANQATPNPLPPVLPPVQHQPSPPPVSRPSTIARSISSGRSMLSVAQYSQSSSQLQHVGYETFEYASYHASTPGAGRPRVAASDQGYESRVDRSQSAFRDGRYLPRPSGPTNQEPFPHWGAPL